MSICVQPELLQALCADRKLRSGQSCDYVDLIVGAHRGTPVTLVAHRLVLQLASPFFATFFSTGLGDGKGTIKLPDLRPDIFEVVLTGFYGQFVSCPKWTIDDRIECLMMLDYLCVLDQTKLMIPGWTCSYPPEHILTCSSTYADQHIGTTTAEVVRQAICLDKLYGKRSGKKEWLKILIGQFDRISQLDIPALVDFPESLVAPFVQATKWPDDLRFPHALSISWKSIKPWTLLPEDYFDGHPSVANGEIRTIGLSEEEIRYVFSRATRHVCPLIRGRCPPVDHPFGETILPQELYVLALKDKIYTLGENGDVCPICDVSPMQGEKFSALLITKYRTGTDMFGQVQLPIARILILESTPIKA